MVEIGKSKANGHNYVYSLKRSCNSENKTAFGFHWMYSDQYLCPELRERRLCSVKRQTCSIKCLETGEVYSSFRAAAKNLGVEENIVNLADKPSIACDTGKRVCGFTWKKV